MALRSSTRGDELPRWLWLGLPPCVVLAQIAARWADEGFYRRVMRGEFGAVEIGTVAFCVLAAAGGLAILLRRAQFPAPWLGLWFALFTAGCVYFGGEEASWGQHWFGWGTPEDFAELNKQAETNLHNLPGAWNALLDKLPRNLLTLAALVGGVIAPLTRLGRRGRLAPWIWPSIVCLPSAALAVLVSVPEKLFERAGRDVPRLLDLSPGETKEFYLASFLFFYAASIVARSSAAAPVGAAAESERRGGSGDPSSQGEEHATARTARGE